MTCFQFLRFFFIIIPTSRLFLVVKASIRTHNCVYDDTEVRSSDKQGSLVLGYSVNVIRVDVLWVVFAGKFVEQHKFPM